MSLFRDQSARITLSWGLIGLLGSAPLLVKTGFDPIFMLIG